MSQNIFLLKNNAENVAHSFIVFVLFYKQK